MFSEWKRKRERKKLQSCCLHEYHKVCEHQVLENVVKLACHYDLYCPLCEREVRVTEKTAERILARQEVRKQYANQNSV